MEDKKKSVVDQTTPTEASDPDAPWVSPEVLAAQAGERVEMGKELPEINTREE